MSDSEIGRFADKNQGYGTIVEHMLDGFYRVTVAGDVVRASPKAVQLLGYDHEDQLIGKVTMADLWVNPNERDLLLAELRERGKVTGFEATLKRKDGSPIRLEMTVAPVFDDSGELVGTDGVIRDVSQRSRSEQQFRSLIRNSPGAIFRYVGGADAHYTFMSDAIESITGYPAAFFTTESEPILKIIHPDDQEEGLAIRQAPVSAGEHYSFELRIVAADGETRWIQIQGSGSADPITYADVVDGVILDVTAAHRVADELAERERQVQSLVRNVPGAIYRFAEGEDGVWRFMFMSPAIETVTGYPPEFFIQQSDPFAKILHPEDRDRVGRTVEEALATEDDFNFEHRVLHRDGTVRWIRVQGSMEREFATGRRFVDGVQLDVTDFYEAREAVERNETMFRHLFDSMAEGYWVTGADSRVQLCNEAAVKILGFPDRESLVGLDTQSIMVSEEQRAAFLADLLASRVVVGREIDVRRNDGVPITLSFSTRLVGEGEQLRSETTFRDVTQQKRIDAEIRDARHAAEQANRAKSTFLANMSHELRTPLNAIIGYSEMMMEEAEELEDDVFSPDLKKVHGAGTHLLSLINDVLDLSKIEAGRMEVFAEDFSIEELINSVTATAEPLMHKNGNTLTLAIEDPKTMLHQDLTKLRQSLLNLLSNAAKFTDRGQVTLTAKVESADDADWFELAVEDSGIGVPAEKHKKLFDEFSQADASTTRQFGGTGLGLAISRRFCRLIGGDITLQSTPGVGSKFTIRVPVKVDESMGRAASADVEKPAQPVLPTDPAQTVLVIDDDPEACDIITRHLTRSGFEAVSALSGMAGLELAKEIRPCAITLDVMMPDMDGWSVLATLKADADLKDIPVVMVSMLDDKSSGYTLGATGYLTKPVDRERLLEAIGKHTGVSKEVLVIEDQEDTRRMIARVLARNGFVVAEAGNGEQGLGAIAQSRPDVVLLDLMMPVMDGFDFLLQMRGRPEWRDIPVVVITAKDLSESERAFLSGRVENVIEKGAYTREQLLALIRNALADVG